MIIVVISCISYDDVLYPLTLIVLYHIMSPRRAQGAPERGAPQLQLGLRRGPSSRPPRELCVSSLNPKTLNPKTLNPSCITWWTVVEQMASLSLYIIVVCIEYLVATNI